MATTTAYKASYNFEMVNWIKPESYSSDWTTWTSTTTSTGPYSNTYTTWPGIVDTDRVPMISRKDLVTLLNGAEELQILVDEVETLRREILLVERRLRKKDDPSLRRLYTSLWDKYMTKIRLLLEQSRKTLEMELAQKDDPELEDIRRRHGEKVRGKYRLDI